MTQRRRRFQRLCALLLLALVASPLTAPFSAGHPLDLLGGAAHVQSKKAPDEPVVSACVGLVTFTPASIVATVVVRQTRRPNTDAHSHTIPLRL
jgi:hypothetical protein